MAFRKHAGIAVHLIIILTHLTISTSGHPMKEPLLMRKENRQFYGSYGLRLNGTDLMLLDGSSITRNENDLRNLEQRKRIYMLSKLGFRTYSAGLGKVLLPKTKASKYQLMKMLVQRYSVCFKAQKKGYKFDQKCFQRKQNQYLRTILRLKFKYIV